MPTFSRPLHYLTQKGGQVVWKETSAKQYPKLRMGQLSKGTIFIALVLPQIVAYIWWCEVQLAHNPESWYKKVYGPIHDVFVTKIKSMITSTQQEEYLKARRIWEQNQSTTQQQQQLAEEFPEEHREVQKRARMLERLGIAGMFTRGAPAEDVMNRTLARELEKRKRQELE